MPRYDIDNDILAAILAAETEDDDAQTVTVKLTPEQHKALQAQMINKRNAKESLSELKKPMDYTTYKQSKEPLRETYEPGMNGDIEYDSDFLKWHQGQHPTVRRVTAGGGKSKAVTKSKVVAKPKAALAAKAKVVAKPKAVAKTKVAAKPKASGKAKVTAKPKAAGKAKALVRQNPK